MRIISHVPAPENSIFGTLPVAMNSKAQVTLAGRVIGRVVGSGVVDEHTLEVEMEIDDEWAMSVGLGIHPGGGGASEVSEC